jgi:hypothetical protein
MSAQPVAFAEVSCCATGSVFSAGTFQEADDRRSISLPFAWPMTRCVERRTVVQVGHQCAAWINIALCEFTGRFRHSMFVGSQRIDHPW